MAGSESVGFTTVLYAGGGGISVSTSGVLGADPCRARLCNRMVCSFALCSARFRDGSIYLYGCWIRVW